MQLSERGPRFGMGRRVVTAAVAGAALVVPLALLERLWVGIVRDQWPCFVGTPNCD